MPPPPINTDGSGNVADSPSEKSLRFSQDDKFFCRLLSKDSSLAHPSARLSYGAAPVAVPFRWETRPGTPKHPAASDVLPPLTPPPSFLYRKKKKAPKPSLAARVLLGLRVRRPKSAPYPPPLLSAMPPSYSSSSSSSSASSDRRLSSSRSTFSLPSCGCSDEDSDCALPHRQPSCVCFGVVLFRSK